MNYPPFRAALVLCALLSASSASAQAVTITHPGGETTYDCSVLPGCTIVVTPPAPVPPPPPPPPACTYDVSPTTLTFPSAGSTRTVTVTPSREGCEPVLDGISPAWLTVALAGPLQLSVTAAPQTETTTRSASLSVAGQTVSVSQEGAEPPPPPPPPPPTGTVITRLDCSRGWPACGWASWTDVNSPYYTAVQSGNGTRFTFRPVSDQRQPYLGWQANFSTTADTIYLRFHLTVHSPFRGRGVGDVWTDKLAIVNNGGSTRAIVQLKPYAAADLSDLSLSTNQNISSNGAPGFGIVIGQRHAIQIKVSRGNGVTFAQWVDNQDCSRPTTVSAPLSYNPSTFNNVGLGFYSNASMASGGSIDFTIENAEIGTSCDPSFR